MGFFFILAIAVAISFFVPIYGEYCGKNEYTNAKECATYHIALTFFWQIIKATNDYGSALTALATIAVACFTGTLWWAAAGQYDLLADQIDLARAEFLATHRPKIRIKHVWLMNEFWYDHPLKVRVVCVNHGATDARILDYGVDFVPVRKGALLPAAHECAFKRTITMLLKSGISGELPELVQSIDEDTEIAVRNGKIDLYCIGFLHYFDGANNLRTTAFCRQLILASATRGRGNFVKVENPDYEYED